jgi:hypothetical protein
MDTQREARHKAKKPVFQLPVYEEQEADNVAGPPSSGKGKGKGKEAEHARMASIDERRGPKNERKTDPAHDYMEGW